MSIINYIYTWLVFHAGSFFINNEFFLTFKKCHVMNQIYNNFQTKCNIFLQPGAYVVGAVDE